MSYGFWRESFVRSAIGNRQLIYSLVKREVAARYRGSIFGVAWALVTPLLLLGVYTLAFSYVFKAKWPIQESQNHVDFSLILFTGLIFHGVLAEVLSRSPSAVLTNANYVKKVVFPLEILPLVVVGSAVFQAAMSLIILIIGILFFNGSLPVTALLAPVVIVPYIVLVSGLAWFLAGLGVYIRDVQQIMGAVITVTLFVSPVFYSITLLPDWVKLIALANPITIIIEEFRKLFLFGASPNWIALGLYSVVALLVALSGYSFFQKVRKGFADVL